MFLLVNTMVQACCIRKNVILQSGSTMEAVAKVEGNGRREES